LGCRQLTQWWRKGDLFVISKILIESSQMIGLQGQIQLRQHNVSKFSDCINQIQIFQVDIVNGLEPYCHFDQVVKIHADLVSNTRMLDLYGNQC
jgi:hypothetical protein